MALPFGLLMIAGELDISIGTMIFDDLVNPANRANLLRQTDEICAFITALPRPRSHPGQRFPAPYLTVMDWGQDERDYAAGHSDRAPRLDADAWAGMVANIRAIAERARDRHGVRAVIHPHAGGYRVRGRSRPDRRDIAPGLAGFCLDTGHMDYSGMDPVATTHWRHADRVDYIHFKDIDAARYADVMSRRIRFFEACAEGVMCRSAGAASTIPPSACCVPRSATAAISPSSRSATPATSAAALRISPRVATSCAARASETGNGHEEVRRHHESEYRPRVCRRPFRLSPMLPGGGPPANPERFTAKPHRPGARRTGISHHLRDATAILAPLGVETGLHRVLDVQFRDGDCRIHKKNALANLSNVKRADLNALRRARQGQPQTKRHIAGWDEDFLANTLAAL